MHLKRLDPSSERGVAMLVVLMALVAGSMLGAVALSAAGADLPFAKASQDRKQAYAAAEAGMAYYMHQLSLNNDYWTLCDGAPGPGPGQPSPVNQRWDGNGADPRVWRTLPGTKSEYTLELIPAGTNPRCVAGSADTTMIDRSSGTFRIRATGRSGGVTRTIVNTLRRASFLDYIYFTDYETTDPFAYDTASKRARAEQECVKPRAQRTSFCLEIQFSSTDAIRGPFHTNDNVLHCGSTEFGRTSKDRIEVSGSPAYNNAGGGSCGGPPDMKGTSVPNAKPLDVPTSNSSLAATALPQYRYTGKTTILLKGNVMDVTTGGVTTTNVPLPPNGVIYVGNGSCSTGTSVPMLARYSHEPAGCGNLYISGTYSKSLTLATANDIIVGGPGTNGNLHRDPSQDVVLGLIATNFVRVYHPVTRSDWSDVDSCTNATGTINDVTIDAAILTLKHSFTVDNYACGAKLGTLRVMGAIAQKFRGAVGTTRPTGYTKDYEYDDRLKYRSPPFFLDPVSAAWGVNRANEQVPAVAERH